MLQILLKFLSEVKDISPENERLLEKSFKPVSYPKNYLIEAAGKVPKYLYFILAGHLRLFYINEKGEEVTTHINSPTGFFNAYPAFLMQRPANENLKSITAVSLLQIDKPGLDALTAHNPFFMDLQTLILQKSLQYNEQRTHSLATLSAEQRYKKLMDTYPEMLRQVPVQYIASFLGMNAKSLSRVRRQMLW